MQTIKFMTLRIIDGEVVDDSGFVANRVHLRRDGEL